MKNHDLAQATIEADTGLTFFAAIRPEGVIEVSRRFPGTPDSSIELTAHEARMLAVVLPHKTGRLEFSSANTTITVSSQAGMRVLGYRFRDEAEITSVMGLPAAERLGSVLSELAPELDELVDALNS